MMRNAIIVLSLFAVVAISFADADQVRSNQFLSFGVFEQNNPAPLHCNGFFSDWRCAS